MVATRTSSGLNYDRRKWRPAFIQKNASGLFRLRGVLIALAVVVCVPAATRAQEAAAPKRGPMAQDAKPDWAVATVRPSDPDAKQVNDRLLAFRFYGRQILIERQSIESMLMVGYGLQKNQIVGGPEWVRTQLFDVDGLPNVEGEPSVEQFQGMIRKLLAERFGLKTHEETRSISVYALTIAKDGPKLSVSKGDRNADGRIQVGGGPGYRTLNFREVSMEDLPVMLVLYLDRPLLDRTSLHGKYDFTLKYTYDEERAPSDGSAPPSLFTAFQEQLGLKLQAMRAPARALVIDAVQKPGAN